METGVARPTTAVVHARRTIVRDCLIAGADPAGLQRLKDEDNRPIFGAGVLEADVAAVRRVWADHDPDWFTRAANARRMAAVRYEAQLERLHAALAVIEKSTPKDGAPPIADIAAIERQITIVIGRLHDVGREIDPANYLNKLRECYILTPEEGGTAHERP